MKTDVQPHGSVMVVTPHGPLTREEVAEFRNTVGQAIASREGRVVLDLQHVPYVDSEGIESLLELCGATESLNRPRLAQLDETCREALDLTEVLWQLEVFDTVESAIRSYKR
ncbi:MAG: STAS domain-containing protein [Phycisphaerae bacterium]|nr:STAS domain-containing protein [Phycisphaerae bacterium]